MRSHEYFLTEKKNLNYMPYKHVTYKFGTANTKYIFVMVAVKKLKSNCNMNEKEVLVAISKRRKLNCSGIEKS
jgi:hypothetical protein